MNGSNTKNSNNVKKKSSSTATNSVAKNKESIKLNKKSATMIGTGVLVILLVVGIFFAFKTFAENRSEKPEHQFEKQAAKFYISKVDGEDYLLGDAVEKTMVGVKWDYDLGPCLVTITGRDRKTKDEIEMVLKVYGYATYVSYTRNGKEMNYNQWIEYLMSY